MEPRSVVLMLGSLSPAVAARQPSGSPADLRQIRIGSRVCGVQTLGLIYIQPNTP
jgi:hypothetical protein